ncbi:hypothetical protein SDC9_147874 [bioreactor metagenome]|uniref:Uncharacterized protein n=1 Tax=bioreactor metagenome TaxID=1076179 RepID=A0A645EF98_9ZZZZ
MPQHLDQLGLVGDAHKALGQRGHDLFAREGCAAALHHVPLGVDLVSAVNVHRQFGHLVGVQHRDANGLQAFGASHRAGDCAANLVLHRGQCVDEFVDRRARAHAHDLARHHILQRGLADQSLKLILRK